MKFRFIKGLHELPSPAQMQKSFQGMRIEKNYDSAGSTSA